MFGPSEVNEEESVCDGLFLQQLQRSELNKSRSDFQNKSIIEPGDKKVAHEKRITFFFFV